MQRSKIVRNVLLGIENLLLHKLRTFLTMLGVVFGVGSVVAMLSVGEGASKEAMDQIKKIGSNNIIVNSMKSVEEASSTTMHSHLGIYGLTYNDQLRIAETFTKIKQIVPVKLVRKKARLGERPLDLRVVGTLPAWFQILRRDIIAGRVLTRADMDNSAGVVVLTEFGARKLLAAENTIGQQLRIGGSYFEIIGIVQSEGGMAGDIQMPDDQIDAYIPLNVAQQRYGDIATIRTAGGNMRELVELHQLIVEVGSIDDVESVAKGIQEMLRRSHKGKEDYRVSVPLALLRQAEATKRTFNIVLGSIAAISLLVGGIGIMNIMLASVTERTREIGVRRAIGAKRRQIISQFLIETIVLSTVGGFIGIGVGMFIPWLITYFAGMPTIVTGKSIVLSVGISITIGIIFGLYPAVRAANVDPIVALRHE